MTATDLIKILEPIPSHLWCTGHFTTILSNGEVAHCVLGHLGYSHKLGADDELPPVYAILDVLKAPSDINDGKPFKYHGKRIDPVGDTPKERILNALREKVKEWL